jgi:hypothetical protein
MNVDSEFLADLADTSSENSLAAYEYLQRALLRALLVQFMQDGQRTPSRFDSLVISGEGLRVVLKDEPIKLPNHVIWVNFSEKLILNDLIEDNETDPGIILRRCITLSWNICKHIAASIGNERFGELCSLYKSVDIGNVSTIEANHHYSSFDKLLMDADEVSDEMMKKYSISRSESAGKYIRTMALAGCLWPIVLGLFLLVFIIATFRSNPL